MSSLKQVELRSRESAVGEVRAYLSGVLERDVQRSALVRALAGGASTDPGMSAEAILDQIRR